jgi:hypothetical protein
MGEFREANDKEKKVFKDLINILKQFEGVLDDAVKEELQLLYTKRMTEELFKMVKSEGLKQILEIIKVKVMEDIKDIDQMKEINNEVFEQMKKEIFEIYMEIK